MAIFLFSNNAQSTLSGSITNTALVLNVQAGGGALFPSPGTGFNFAITLTDAATGLLREVMYCSNRAGDTFTVIRGQEGTVALNWTANDLVANLWTAGQAAAMLQQGQAQGQTSNYAPDTGAANAYVCALNPSLVTPVIGMPIRVKILNTNNGASTLNPGPGAAPIVDQKGNPLLGGELVANTIEEFFWNNTLNAYQWNGVASQIPPGSLFPYAGVAAPGGYLLCGGQAVSRVTFATLFAILGTVYGIGDGSTTFNVPDLRGRVAAGLDGMGPLGAANRLTGSTVSPNGNTLGASGGSQLQTAVTNVNITGSTTGSLSVSVSGSGTTGTETQPGGSAGGGGTNFAINLHTHPFSLTSSGSSSGSLSVSGSGSGTSGSFSIVQPTLVLNMIIKY